MALALPCTSAVPRYDVFLSFRGEDTRDSFTDHLYQALGRAGVRTFRDNDGINRGDHVKQEIKKAIRVSRASIIIFSEKYAKSRWCLDELLLIHEQWQNFSHFVLPVFYHVDPSDIRNQRHSFAIKVSEIVKGAKQTDVNVNQWKKALTEVANLAGIVVSGPETLFIAKIVDTIYKKLDLKLVSTPSHLTGMHTRAEAINSWLKDEQSNVDILAICGMGGSGKTTLAKYIYNSNKQIFQSSSFLEEIGKNCEQPNGLLGLQKQLLRDILGDKNIETLLNNVSEGTNKIEEALQMKRVLIVLDDIDDQEELVALLGSKMFHTQSKIIITSRVLDIYAWFRSISWKCSVHKLKLLNDHESLELLSFYAFGSKTPMEGFKKLAEELVQYCDGNPLALKVLGSSLFISSEDMRKDVNIIDIWRSTLNSLNSLKGDLDYKIQCILRRSFDSLPRDSHRELFLHISFFFVGEYEDYVVKILENDWHAKAGIMTLTNRCLLTVSSSNKLMIHRLLQEMARKIVSEESKNSVKRSRVSHADESYRVLKKGDGSDTIEGLALDMRKLTQGMTLEPPAIKTISIAKMDKLKLLQLKDVKLTGSYKNFPRLIWFCWRGCHLRTILPGLLMNSLVALDMSYGNLEKFEPPTVLNSLKILNFKACQKLVSIHNFRRFPNLETLILWDCSCLTYVSKTIRCLEKLTLLDLTGCKNLWKVSFETACINRCIDGGTPQQLLFALPNSLEFLFLNDCDFQDGNDVPNILDGQLPLYMNLGNNLFEFLPNSIDLKMLRVLDLTSCYRLKSLLNLPRTLEELYTYSCTALEKITFQSARYRLRKFGYVGCTSLSEIQGLFKLVSIAKLHDAELGHMKWIKAYQYENVDLVGDEITRSRIWDIQMLSEYGIRSTFLPYTKDKRLTYDYMSASPSLSFRVPLCSRKRRIQGLNVSCKYRSTGKGEDNLVLFAKISSTTKGRTWIYNPVVYSKPKAHKDVVWLSYWPIGNILNTRDEINVSIIVGSGLKVSGCGVSIVYTDEENFENHTNEEEVIGGDLSEFELITGVYYLCRRDFTKLTTPHWFKMLIGDTVHYTEFQRWGKSRESEDDALFMELNTFRGIRCGITQLVQARSVRASDLFKE